MSECGKCGKDANLVACARCVITAEARIAELEADLSVAKLTPHDYWEAVREDRDRALLTLNRVEAELSTERELRESLQQCQQTTCDRSPPPYCDRHNPRIAELEQEIAHGWRGELGLDLLERRDERIAELERECDVYEAQIRQLRKERDDEQTHYIADIADLESATARLRGALEEYGCSTAPYCGYEGACGLDDTTRKTFGLASLWAQPKPDAD